MLLPDAFSRISQYNIDPIFTTELAGLQERPDQAGLAHPGRAQDEMIARKEICKGTNLLLHRHYFLSLIFSASYSIVLELEK
ncbi:hypothetical protein JCM15765_04540 [Paradesulfitobacterium aromaticivorans]